jgi:cysteine desulfurase/selenocysteine lyase
MISSRRQFLKSVALSAAATSPLATWAADTLETRPTPADFWESVRKEFPLDPTRSYLNNGAIGASPRCVLNAVQTHMLANERAPEHDELTTPREKLAQFVGALPEEIAFTHNTTEGINVIVWGLDLRPGDEVILTTHEHAGGAIPWLQRARVDGITLRTFEPRATADEVLEQINALIGPRTRVIAVPHVSCTTGQLFPLDAIARLAQERGLVTAIDGAHGPGMLPLALRPSGVDYYASCGHKWLCGPKGTGFVYVRKERLEELRPTFVGASTDLGWDLSVTPPVLKGFVPSAHRFEYGSRNQSLAAGLEAAVDFHQRIGSERIRGRGRELSDSLVRSLQERGARIDLLSPLEEVSRSAMVGFRLKTVSTETFWKAAKARGIRIRWIGEAGLDSIRVSTHLYNSPQDIRKLVSLVDEF